MKKILLSLCIICLLVCGCSQSSNASKTVNTFLKEGKNAGNNNLADLGLDSLEGETGMDFDEETLTSLINAIGDYDYKVNSEKEEGDKATVNVTITTYDFSEWMTNSLTEIFSQAFALAFTGDTSDEAVNELMNRIFKEQTEAVIATGKTKSSTVDIICKKVDGKWEVDEEATGDALADALSGGMLSSMKNIESELENIIN